MNSPLLCTCLLPPEKLVFLPNLTGFKFFLESTENTVDHHNDDDNLETAVAGEEEDKSMSRILLSSKVSLSRGVKEVDIEFIKFLDKLYLTDKY